MSEHLCELCGRELVNSGFCQPNAPMILISYRENFEKTVCHTCYMVYTHGASCTCQECTKTKIPMMGERE